MERSREKQLSNRARRHFLGVTAAMAARIAVVAPFASAAVSSSANADGGNNNNQGGDNNNQGGGGLNCFLKGTRILTPQGEARIEDLRIGDLVTTAGGKAVPIKWLGRNSYKKSDAAWPRSVVPIRISRFAIDEDTPRNDLYLSPKHALFIDGILIPVKELVNGTSIVSAIPPNMETLEYLQIVLDTHEVIWAEGVRAETFVAKGKADYEVFANFAEYDRLYPTDSYTIPPLAPELIMGGRAHLKGLLEVGLTYFLGVTNPIDDLFDRIDARAERLKLAA